MQFIVTTHSPSVILGALDIAQIIKTEGGELLTEDVDKFFNYDVSRLLLSNLFELENVRTDMYQELLRQRIEIANKRDDLSVEDIATRETLDSLLANYTSVQVEDLKALIQALK